MPTRATIEYEESPSDVCPRIERAVRAGLKSAAEQWHREMLPGHFEPTATKKYGYQPLSGEGEPSMLYKHGIKPSGGRSARLVKNRKYYWFKYWYGPPGAQGTHKPLVYSGQSQEGAMERASVSVVNRGSGTNEGTVRMLMPLYFFKRAMRNDGTMSPDKVKELTATTEDERTKLIETASRVAQAKVDAGEGRRRQVHRAA
jgi:hypothetical protein